MNKTVAKPKGKPTVIGQPGRDRGHALDGARAIAKHIWNDQKKSRRAYLLDRKKYGLIMLSGKLTGWSGWIDEAIERQAGRIPTD